MKINLIIERLCAHFKANSNKELAEKLGISPTTLSNWKNRNTIDYELIIEKCQNVDLNWLFLGENTQIENHTQEPPRTHKALVSEPMIEYGVKHKNYCSHCIDKERVIDSQQAHIDTLQRELLRAQSELDELKNTGSTESQKRRVG